MAGFSGQGMGQSGGAAGQQGATGPVSDVTATAPLTSSGGATPDISTSIATARVVGRTTAGTGVMEELTVTAPLALGTGTLTTSLATNKLLGRATAGTGALEAITLGTNLSFTGTTLNASGGGGGTQGGSTGATTNALSKATAADTLADSGIVNASGAILTPASGDALQLGSGDYPKQTNIGGATNGFPAICSQAGKLLVVTGDGLGSFADLKALGLIASTDSLTIGTNLLTNTNGTFFRQDKYLSFGPSGFASLTSGFDASTAGVIKISDGTTGQGWLTNGVGTFYAASNQTVTNTTLTADTELTTTLKAGRKYSFYIMYFFNIVTTTDGFKFDLNGGSATATNIIAQSGLIKANGTHVALTASRSTALNTSISVADTVDTTFAFYCEGSIQCNAAGTFIPQFAKNSSAAGANLVKQIGTYMNISDLG